MHMYWWGHIYYIIKEHEVLEQKAELYRELNQNYVHVNLWLNDVVLGPLSTDCLEAMALLYSLMYSFLKYKPHDVVIYQMLSGKRVDSQKKVKEKNL